MLHYQLANYSTEYQGGQTMMCGKGSINIMLPFTNHAAECLAQAGKVLDAPRKSIEVPVRAHIRPYFRLKFKY